MKLLSSIRRPVARRQQDTGFASLPRPEIRGKSFSRAGQKLSIRGVTYGPFAPNSQGIQFPETKIARQDFAWMRQFGFNAARTYIVPPADIFELAAEQGILLFVDIPWRKHICFLQSRVAQEEAHVAMRSAAQVGVAHSNLLAYSIGNEIPTEIIRWHGSRKIEQFLAELQDDVKQTDPKACVTYASFPRPNTWTYRSWILSRSTFICIDWKLFAGICCVCRIPSEIGRLS